MMVYDEHQGLDLEVGSCGVHRCASCLYVCKVEAWYTSDLSTFQRFRLPLVAGRVLTFRRLCLGCCRS
jgi:hypothetical protein